MLCIVVLEKEEGEKKMVWGQGKTAWLAISPETKGNDEIQSTFFYFSSSFYWVQISKGKILQKKKKSE